MYPACRYSLANCSLVAYFISRVAIFSERKRPTDRFRRVKVTTIAETKEGTPRLLRSLSLSAKGGASRVARLCARSGDRRRDDDSRRVLLLLPRDCIVVNELLSASWSSKKKGVRKQQRTEVDRRKTNHRREKKRKRARNSRWV